MPKKKKNCSSQGPQHGGECGSGPESRAYRTNGSAVTLPDSSWRLNKFGSTLSSSGQSGSQSRDEVIQNMQEMFSHLDPEVIYMVLSEADFKVDNAMDCLLELSNAAEGTALAPRVSVFEQAAAVLEAGHAHTQLHSETTQSFSCSNQPASQLEIGPDETYLTEEFDTLLDQELETSVLQQTQASSQPLISSIPLSALPPPFQSTPLSSLPRTSQTQLPASQTLSELAQLNKEGNKCGQVPQQTSYSSPRQSEACGGSSPVSELGFGGVHIPEHKSISLDFSHLTGEVSSTEPRPSAFQVYRRPHQLHNHTEVSAVSQHKEALSTPTMFWNPQAAEFHPRSVEPVFISPVVPNPTPWNMNPIPAAQWLAHRPIRQAPLKPSATVPKSWTLSPKNRLKMEGQVLVLLRGAPGSGKTTLATSMLDQNPGGVVLSTDNYFIRNGQYHYEPHLLGEAHEWNHQRAKEAFEKGQTPIIIDNTNMQRWEMKPYVAMAQERKYKVLFREPDTWWKTKPRELEKRTRHQVTKEKIRRMLDRYDRFVSVQSIMNSQRPEPVLSVRDLPQTEASQPQQFLPSGNSHPDLVGHSGLSKLIAQPSSVHVVSSVSTIPNGEEECEIRSFSSKEPMFSENILESSGLLKSNLLNGEQLDLELDACFVDSKKKMGCLLSRPNEEFAVTTKEKFLEQPEFSESIGQRVRKDRAIDRNERVANATDHPINFDPNNESSGQDKHEGCEDQPLSGDSVVQPELLEFVGDWPMESQGQRQGRRKNSRNAPVKNMESSAVVERENVSSNEDKQSGTKKLHKVEFQKLVDLQGKGNSSPGLHHTTPSKKMTPQHSPLLGSKEGNLETWAECPDCVQESTGHSKDVLNSPNPAKLEQTEQSSQVSAEKSTAMHTQEEVEKEEIVASEEKSRMSTSIQDSQCSRGGVESESSLERHRGLSRRMSKCCKLALTFTNHSPSSPSSQSSVISHLPPDLTPPGVTPSLQMVSCSIASTQTHPQDFALLWRIDQQGKQTKYSSAASDFSGSAVVILEGNSLRFTPKANEEQSACQQGLPYHVVHEKCSQVEENDCQESHSNQYNLEILSHHFRCVSMDILEDPYDKCNQDMEWTTNLLLVSEKWPNKDDDQEANVESFVSAEEFDYNQDRKKVPATLTLEAVKGSDVDQARAACADEQNVAESSNSSTSSIHPKFQKTISSDLSQADHDWSTGQSSQSEAEGSNKGLHMIKEKSEISVVEEPTENTNTQLEVPAANKEEQDKTDQHSPSKEETLLRQSEQIVQCLEGALGGWNQEGAGEKEKEEEQIRTEVDSITQLLLHQTKEMERREEEESKKQEKERRADQERRKPGAMDIQTLELKLPTELALQLIELFGPVGVSPGAFSSGDCAVQIDMNLAKLLHQKWKETIQEKHRQAALSYQLLPENSVYWGKSQGSKTGLRDQPSLYEEVCFMDHWSVSCPSVSLRNIMIEEQVMQNSMEKSRSGQRDLYKKDSAVQLKENQLFSMFPTIDRHFLRDIFRDHNYSLEQTKQFLHVLLDDGPVKNVVASETAPQRNGTSRAPSKERRWKQQDLGADELQDTEDPEYKDFRTEAVLHSRQQSFNNAAEAYRQGCKGVAGFYAQQSHMYGEKMRESNHRAASQIFERVNASLLSQNIVNLHALHMDEAVHHLDQALADKTLEWHQGLCGPQLSIITGRGNHRQGGVACVRPAVLDYLKRHEYSYTEPKPGLLLVTLH